MKAEETNKAELYMAMNKGELIARFSARSREEAEDILETDYPEASELYLLVCSWPD